MPILLPPAFEPMQGATARAEEEVVESGERGEVVIVHMRTCKMKPAVELANRSLFQNAVKP
jgi:hypothetical protein